MHARFDLFLYVPDALLDIGKRRAVAGRKNLFKYAAVNRISLPEQASNYGNVAAHPGNLLKQQQRQMPRCQLRVGDQTRSGRSAGRDNRLNHFECGLGGG